MDQVTAQALALYDRLAEAASGGSPAPASRPTRTTKAQLGVPIALAATGDGDSRPATAP